jgi:subtilisin family serine protease
VLSALLAGIAVSLAACGGGSDNDGATADTTPDSFSFVNVADVAAGTEVTSAPVTISGIDGPSPISVTGGSYSLGCGTTFTTSAGSIGNGQTVCVRHTSAAAAATTTQTRLDVGGVSATFTSTTVAAAATSSKSLVLLTGTAGAVEFAAPGVAVLDELGVEGDATAGLVVSAAAAMVPEPDSDGVVTPVAVRVHVSAVTAAAGMRRLAVIGTGCTVLPADGACPSGSAWSGRFEIELTITAPTTEVPADFPTPAPEAWQVLGDGTVVLPNTVEILVEPPLDAAAMPELAASIEATIVAADTVLGVYWLRVADVTTAVAQLSATAGVALAGPVIDQPVLLNDVVPADYEALPRAPERRAYTFDQGGVTAAWRASTAIAQPALGIIDFGIYVRHPDLQPSTASYYSEAATPIAALQAGSHGTHVAGILCGANGNGGAVGVAYGCRLRAFDLGGTAGTPAQRLASFRTWLRKYPDVRVVNMSLSLAGSHQNNKCEGTFPAALLPVFQKFFNDFPDTLFVAAAGNCGKGANGPLARESVKDSLPAAMADNPSFPTRNVIAVSSTADADDNPERFLSQSSAPDGDIAAPGVAVYSSVHGTCNATAATVSCDTMTNGGVDRKSGTSMAAPYVAGVAGLLLGEDPDLDAETMKGCLLQGAVTWIDGIINDLDPPPIAVKEISAPAALQCLERDYIRQANGANGLQPNGESNLAGMSADGMQVLIGSGASNLVAGDTNLKDDVFVWNRATNDYERQPNGFDGRQPDEQSQAIGISADGSRVVLVSEATNLVEGRPSVGLYVWERGSASYLRAPLGIDGAEPRISIFEGFAQSQLSANGRRLAFCSNASNLVADDFNDQPDVFVWDIDAGRYFRQPGEGDGRCGENPAISADGNVVAFESLATNLVAGDTNEEGDVFLWGVAAGTLQRVNTDALRGIDRTGPFFNHWIGQLSPTGDELLLSVHEQYGIEQGDSFGATDVYVLKAGALQRRPGAKLAGGLAAPGGLSTDLSRAGVVSSSLEDDNPTFARFVYLWDRVAGTLVRQPPALGNVDPDGEVQESRNLLRAMMAGDGSVVGFRTTSTNLVPGDTNELPDVYLWRLPRRDP